MKDATRKLSKRYGDASYEDFIKKGYLSEAIINYIALLGWSPKNDMEKFSLKEMEEMFSIEGLSKSASIFDETKMRWLNSLYVKDMTDEQYYEYAVKFFDQVPYLKGYDYRLLASLLKGRTEVFSDVGKLTEFLTEFDGYDLKFFENEKWKTDGALAKTMLPDLIDLTETNAADDFATLHDALVAYAQDKGYKKGQVLWVYRIALTGSLVTPGGAVEMAKLLKKDESIRRLKASLNRL
jgi:glutamyl-tRNA synthetase